MTKKSAIYTRTGDQGETSLVSGTRVKKCDPRVNVYGHVDELNSWLGVIVSEMNGAREVQRWTGLLEDIQHNLFNLGSNLACEADKRTKHALPPIDPKLITTMEEKMDEMDEGMPPLHNFILPGGSRIGAVLHIARTVCRRAERVLLDFALKNSSEIPPHATDFINRLSDFLFVLARFANHSQGAKETLWKNK